MINDWYDIGYRRGFDGRADVLGQGDSPDSAGRDAAEQGYRDGEHDRQVSEERH